MSGSLGSSPLPAEAERDRQHRAVAATSLQARSAMRGAVQYGVIGGPALLLAGRYWPALGGTTPAFKFYLFTIIMTFGAVIRSDHDLVDHQLEQKTGDLRAYRRQAVEALHERGEFPSEGKVFAEMKALETASQRPS